CPCCGTWAHLSLSHASDGRCANAPAGRAGHPDLVEPVDRGYWYWQGHPRRISDPHTSGMEDHRELGGFLRSRRARVAPERSGVPTGPRRRVPGLRREEVAQLAGISVEYYIRLEQGRAVRPSEDVLAAIARALDLDDVEH